MLIKFETSIAEPILEVVEGTQQVQRSKALLRRNWKLSFPAGVHGLTKECCILGGLCKAFATRPSWLTIPLDDPHIAHTDRLSLTFSQLVPLHQPVLRPCILIILCVVDWKAKIPKCSKPFHCQGIHVPNFLNIPKHSAVGVSKFSAPCFSEPRCSNSFAVGLLQRAAEMSQSPGTGLDDRVEHVGIRHDSNLFNMRKDACHQHAWSVTYPIHDPHEMH